MKDIEIKINRETRMVNLSKTIIGNDAENLQGNLIFSFNDEFVEGQARLEYEIEKQKNFISLERIEEKYVIPIKSVITKEGSINMQLVITEGINEENIAIFKSNIFYVYCNRSINAEIEQPDEYATWIEIANTKLNQVDNVDIDITTTDGTTSVEITRKDGTKKSAIVSGEGGGNEVEKDPTVPTHVKNIKETDISSWNNKSNFSGSYNDLLNVPSNLAKTNQNNNFSTSQTINGTLTINGDIVQNGESYETHAEQLYTEKDEIITRDGAVGGLSDGEYTGIQATLYDGINNGRLGFNANGEARVGDIGDEQPLLTRDEATNLQTGQVLIWDGTNLRAIGSSDYVKNNDVATQTKLGLVKMWTSINEDGDVGLNISTEV